MADEECMVIAENALGRAPRHAGIAGLPFPFLAFCMHLSFFLFRVSFLGSGEMLFTSNGCRSSIAVVSGNDCCA